MKLSHMTAFAIATIIVSALGAPAHAGMYDYSWTKKLKPEFEACVVGSRVSPSSRHLSTGEIQRQCGAKYGTFRK